MAAILRFREISNKKKLFETIFILCSGTLKVALFNDLYSGYLSDCWEKQTA